MRERESRLQRGAEGRATTTPAEIWSVAWRALAVLCLLPDHTRRSHLWATRQQLHDRLDWLHDLDPGDPLREAAFRTAEMDNALAFLDRWPDVITRHHLAGSTGSEVDAPIQRIARDVESLTLVSVDWQQGHENLERVDALCWLIRSLHHDTTEAGRASLQLPPSVTGLSRVLATLLRDARWHALHRRVMWWFADEAAAVDDADLPDDSPDPGWPDVRFRALAYDRLGRGRPPSPAWPMVRAARLRAIALACRDGRRCTLTYTSSTRGPLHREVDPWYLALRRGRWYLIAVGDDVECDSAPDVYRLERIVELKAHGRATRRRAPDLERARQALQFDPVRPGRATVRIHDDRVPPPQGSTPRESPVAGTTDHELEVRAFRLRGWALANAPDAEVLSPAALRGDIAERCTAIADRHREPASSETHTPARPSRPDMDGVESERQFASMLTLRAWDQGSRLRTADAMTWLGGRTLGYPDDGTGLPIVLGSLERVTHDPSRARDYIDDLPIVALTYEERLAVATVLVRARQLPLETVQRQALVRLTDWLRPVLRTEDILIVADDAPAATGEQHADVLVEAQRHGHVLRIVYSGRGGQQHTRIVSPWWFSASERHTYIYAHEHEGGRPRWYRLDRIREAELEPGTTHVAAPIGRDRPESAPAAIQGDHPTYVLKLDPPAWWLLDELSPDTWPEDVSGGAITVEVTSDIPRFIHQLVVRGAGHAELLAPEADREAIGELAARCAERHLEAGLGDVSGP